MYISAQDLINAFSESALIQLTNDSSRATEINQTVLNAAMQFAQETTDGYLRSRYVLPLESVPTIVRNICLQIARYWIYSRRPEGKGFPENVKDTYARAIKELEAIQNGKLHLGLPEAGQSDLVPETLKFKTRAQVRMDLSGY